MKLPNQANLDGELYGKQTEYRLLADPLPINQVKVYSLRKLFTEDDGDRFSLIDIVEGGPFVLIKRRLAFSFFSTISAP